MIRDASVLIEIRQSWNGVEILRDRLKASAFASMSGIGGMFPSALADAAHNLPFFHAYAVLNDVLMQLRDEGRFDCAGWQLGNLLSSSKNKLPWRDFDRVDEGRERRNDVAHRGDLLNRGDCWKYVDAVKDELCGWGVVEGS